MRYDATIRYQKKVVAIKVQNKKNAKNFELTEYLKLIREIGKLSFEDLAKSTGYSAEVCEQFENGAKYITKSYLKALAKAYGLPAKIKYLGIIEDIDTSKIIAERIKELRYRDKLTQQMVAEDLNIARSTYGCYETGRNQPDIDMLVKIANYYNVPLDYLVGRNYN